jgi:hypothetical protein
MEKAAYVVNCWESGGFTKEDGKQLKSMHTHKAFRRMMREVLGEASERSAALAGADLATEEGVKTAIKSQGMVIGLERAVDIILDLVALAETEEEEDA